MKKYANVKNGPKVTMGMLLGTGSFLAPNAQVVIPKQILKEITANAVLAWRAIPPPGTKGTTLSGVRQSNEELYQTLVSRLEEAISRMLPPSEGTDILVKQLAWENANSLCQDLIRPIRKSGLYGCLTSSGTGNGLCCSNERSTVRRLCKTDIWRWKNRPPPTCFDCGETGYIRKGYKKGKQGRQNSNRKQAPGLCPRCLRGRHWKNECKSKFNKDGIKIEDAPGQSKNQMGGTLSAPHKERAALQKQKLDYIHKHQSLLCMVCQGQLQEVQG